MPFAVSCTSCGSRFALTDELYQRKVKGRIVTVRCKNCKKDISVDGVELASRPSNAPPEPPIDEGTPTVPLAIEVADRPLDTTPTAPISRSASDHPPVEGLWVVSYGETDDRELTLVQVERALGRGEIRGDTLVWREGMEEWKSLSAVPELAELAKRSKQDKTGGLFGTGMSSPPPKPSRPPAKPAEDETGPFKSAGAGTLQIKEDKQRTKPEPPKVPRRETRKTKPDIPSRLPKAPPPQKREIVAEEVDDEPAPVSSGTPDLRTLTTTISAKSEKESQTEDDILGVGGSGALGPVLGPPTIDLSGLTAPAAEPEELEAESAPPSEIEVEVEAQPKTRRESPRARGSAAPVRRAAPAEEPEKKSNVLPLLLLAGAAALAVWWLFLRPKPPPVDTAPPAPATETPAEPVTTRTAEPSPAVETASSEPAPAPPPTGTTAPAPIETKPEPTQPTEAKPAPEKDPVNEPAKPPEKKPEPEKEVALAPPFDRGAASAALSAAAGRASACRKEGDPSGTATVIVTFAPSGRVTSANVSGPPFAGTQTGGCIASTMRSAKVPAFSGDKVTVSKTVVIN